MRFNFLAARRSQHSLLEFMASSASQAGDERLRSLVRYFAETLHARGAFLGEVAGRRREKIRARTYWANGRFETEFEFDLAGAPCETVIGKTPRAYPHGVRKRFPNARWLERRGVEGYLGVPLFDSSGQALGVLAALHNGRLREKYADPAVLKILAAQAGSAMERLLLKENVQRLEAECEELKHNSFASVASHDLREPLRKIIFFGDKLQRNCGAALGERGKTYVGRMQNAVMRMQNLIDSLLGFARLGGKPPNFRPVNLETVVSEVLFDLEIRIAETGGSVIVKKLPRLFAEEFQMRQLFQNLIANALKFCRRDCPPAVVLDSREILFGYWEITVSDNGIGFDEKYADRIFKPLERLHGRTEYEGSGMGLSICREIVRLHGGTIAAESRPGQGTTFVVTLPQTPAEENVLHAS